MRLCEFVGRVPGRVRKRVPLAHFYRGAGIGVLLPARGSEGDA